MQTQYDASVENDPALHRKQSFIEVLPGNTAEVPAGHLEQPEMSLPSMTSR
jgi:hypothetical protein